MKFRVIPSILTDKQTVVKGEKFNNWRTVGMAQATAMLFAKRNVDELIFLDVNATEYGSVMPDQLVEAFSQLLDIPFAVGGGVRDLASAKQLFRLGAEKVVLGTAAIENPSLITQLAETFGSQAVVVAIDSVDESGSGVVVHSGNKRLDLDPIELAIKVQAFGAGELIIQSVPHDGKLKGMNWSLIERAVSKLTIPVIASSGASSAKDFMRAYELGASGVAAGALFQFTENTPQSVSDFLRQSGVPVRNI